MRKELHKHIVIVVPVYKSQLTYPEKISIMQLKRVLRDYEIVYVIPKSLQADYIKENRQEKFDDEYFADTDAYSRLMTSKIFYERFSEYQYMLIYQPDCFVFSDHLEEFCNLNLDYIGAPVPAFLWNRNIPVGNGGFSLRKIHTFIHILSKVDFNYYKDEYVDLFRETSLTEDKFFGLCGTHSELHFNVAARDVAERFAVEYNVRGIYEQILNGQKELPFGCHRWYRENFDFYEKIIKPIVISYNRWLTPAEIKKYTSSGEYEKARRKYLNKFLLKRLRSGHGMNAECEIYELLNVHQRKIAIWGCGRKSADWMHELTNLGIQIECAIDKNASHISDFMGLNVISPEEIFLRDVHQYFIVITTSKYALEIETYLTEHGLQKDADFMMVDCLIDKICKFYFEYDYDKYSLIE